MSARYRTEAINRDGGDGVARITDGMAVEVSSPLGAHVDESASNPEQLLALSWATCLNATAQTIVRGRQRTAVRVVVELHPADPGPGFAFHVDAFLSVEGADAAEAEELLAAAHARCPVSKLIGAAATVHVHVEEFVS